MGSAPHRPAADGDGHIVSRLPCLRVECWPTELAIITAPMRPDAAG